MDFVSVADVVGSWERVNTMHTMEELAFFTGSTCTDDVGTSTSDDMESVPSSIQSSVSLLSPLEAREKVRKLALQANNVDDFFELIPDDLLDNFFSDYKMLVQHKMLEEQCDNIREELMKQSKRADD
ncbi:unnamed protein product [Meloidogyne enterolobii]|uniref:Uncharacterized protein n=1 Tax=Meloidogyne enterolobii TaxID=390850 RepID=A0ACB0Z0G3_MELEN